jgi:hypothetical protein
MTMPKTVWVCTSGEDHEPSGVDAVYVDVHGARAWLTRTRARVIRDARKFERELAAIEERKPDYSGFYFSELAADEYEWNSGSAWWRIAEWKVTP